MKAQQVHRVLLRHAYMHRHLGRIVVHIISRSYFRWTFTPIPHEKYIRCYAQVIVHIVHGIFNAWPQLPKLHNHRTSKMSLIYMEYLHGYPQHIG